MLSEAGYSDDIVEYTVYKSKIEFDRLKKAIKDRETMSQILNLVLLIIFGIIDIILIIFSFIYRRDFPILGVIPIQAATEILEIPEEISKIVDPLVLDSFVFSIIKSFSIIVWYFMSNYFIK